MCVSPSHRLRKRLGSDIRFFVSAVGLRFDRQSHPSKPVAQWMENLLQQSKMRVLAITNRDVSAIAFLTPKRRSSCGWQPLCQAAILVGAGKHVSPESLKVS